MIKKGTWLKARVARLKLLKKVKYHIDMDIFLI